LTSGYHQPKGTPIETDPIDGEPCRFQTCYPVTLWPLDVTSAALDGPPFQAPQTPFSSNADSIIKLQLSCWSPDVRIGQLEFDSLRFFLKAQSQHVFPLYELIFNNTLGVALVDSEQAADPILLSRDCISPVGFERDDGMLPYSNRSFVGYRLLSEYFVFPEKLLFWDLSLSSLSDEERAGLGRTLDIVLFLDRGQAELEQHVSKETFQLGCTPIINLFQQRAEPIRLTHTESEYRVVPDARRPLAKEIYSIDRVTATSPQNDVVQYQPFFSFKHVTTAEQQSTFWQASRQAAESSGSEPDHGTEVMLKLVDLDLSPAVASDWTLDVETTCLNRDLPHRIPFGGGQSRLQTLGGEPITAIEYLTPPTPTYRPALRHGAMWRMISQLTLNHLSLCDSEHGGDVLREILAVYDAANSEETRSMIDGITSVSTRRIVGRSTSGVSGGLCRGLEVSVEFDEDRFVGSGVFLFAAVLERFLGLYCSINSFSKLVATTNKREGVLKAWPPRAGDKVLL
jgi:type VI secretion system protein ImpG